MPERVCRHISIYYFAGVCDPLCVWKLLFIFSSIFSIRFGNLDLIFFFFFGFRIQYAVCMDVCMLCISIHFRLFFINTIIDQPTNSTDRSYSNLATMFAQMREMILVWHWSTKALSNVCQSSERRWGNDNILYIIHNMYNIYINIYIIYSFNF